MEFKYVEYMSIEYYNLNDNWITWDILELNGVKIAQMVWSKYL